MASDSEEEFCYICHQAAHHEVLLRDVCGCKTQRVHLSCLAKWVRACAVARSDSHPPKCEVCLNTLNVPPVVCHALKATTSTSSASHARHASLTVNDDSDDSASTPPHLLLGFSVTTGFLYGFLFSYVSFSPTAYVGAIFVANGIILCSHTVFAMWTRHEPGVLLQNKPLEDVLLLMTVYMAFMSGWFVQQLSWPNLLTAQNLVFAYLFSMGCLIVFGAADCCNAAGSSLHEHRRERTPVAPAAILLDLDDLCDKAYTKVAFFFFFTLVCTEQVLKVFVKTEGTRVSFLNQKCTSFLSSVCVYIICAHALALEADSVLALSPLRSRATPPALESLPQTLVPLQPLAGQESAGGARLSRRHLHLRLQASSVLLSRVLRQSLVQSLRTSGTAKPGSSLNNTKDKFARRSADQPQPSQTTATRGYRCVLECPNLNWTLTSPHTANPPARSRARLADQR